MSADGFQDHQDSLPRSLANRIPGEIFDHIIDHLHNDLPSLLRCALISRSWLRTSRYHLPALEIRRRNASTLKKLLSSPHATLGMSTRRVAIRAGKLVRPARFLGALLPAVESLLIKNPYLPIAEILSWIPYAQQLVEFVLYDTLSDSLSGLVEGLYEFKALRHLALIGVHWIISDIASSGEDRTFDDSDFLPSLCSLVLEGDSVHLVAWLLERNVVSIQRLDLNLKLLPTSQTGVDIRCYNRLLGPNLRELDVHRDDLALNSIDLSTNVNLREIWFHDVLLSRGDWVITVLSKVTSVYLRSITLYIFSDDDDIDTFNWSAFGKMLARSPFREHLGLVRVLWDGPFDYGDKKVEVLDRLAEHLPGNVEYTVDDVASEADTFFGVTTHEHLFDRHSRAHFGVSWMR